MAIDDYDFTKPGAVPFQWEIRPGVPKIQHQKQAVAAPPSPQPCDYNLSPLKPPPSGTLFVPPEEPRTQSFRSGAATRTRGRVVLERCPNPHTKSEPDYTNDLETLSRWSISSRKSLLSPTSMSSYSSYQSSPRPVSDAEWAGFGLF
ncbi:hypothetical protein M0R45_011356 [Rubus argutus]|uniref:Uncharacterized protein n=1 Tax=Rubus argutus TaxID=59490 RepID=A0AAW1YAZ3_RUBAR